MSYINKLKRRLCKDECKLDHAKKRYCLLRLTVGSNIYKEVNQAVHDIISIRATSKAWTTLNLFSPDGLTAKDVMPPEMKYVYFESKLVSAFFELSLKTSTFQPQQVDKYQWIELLNEAKQNLIAFRKIEKEAKEKGGGKFMCMSGMCALRK